mmetsp:Transcript_17545/g.37991  ORF Transcript_17545/g.37991 Transcript_17545/m.37991 type:complete len:594 (-) Transcript_17545:2281-4062(-)
MWRMASHPERRSPRSPFRYALFIFLAGLCIGRLIGIGGPKKDGQASTAINVFQQRDSPPGYLFDPVKIPPRCPRKQRRRVIDMTLINNELSSLELRLNELWNVVDTFFIAESTVPFKPGALSKPHYLADHWSDFERFHSKMVLITIDPVISQGTGAKVDLVDFRPNFNIQVAQRDELWRQLKKLGNLREDDLIIKADLDEIPRPSIIEELACIPPGKLPHSPICLETMESFFYYNFNCRIKFEWTASPSILRYKDEMSYKLPCRTQIANSSTHCSSCFGSLDDYHVKSISNSEPIRNPLQTNNASILERVRSCKDFWLRTGLDEQMELKTHIDFGSVPMIVSKHPERWPHLLGNGPLYESLYVDEQTVAAKKHTIPMTTKAEGSPICQTAQECIRPYFPNPEKLPCPVRESLQTSSTGAYILPQNFVYRFDQGIANEILNIVSGRVLELGAGLGCYTHYFKNSKQLAHVSGFEGASNVDELTGGFIKHADLTEKHDFGKFDYVISLEVAEHIPAAFESAFVANIIAPSPKGIILSWALPDQPGSGHVNGKTNEYVISLMGAKGFEYDMQTTMLLRSQAELSWFKETTMVFTAK